jgi:hypothetical protein
MNGEENTTNRAEDIVVQIDSMTNDEVNDSFEDLMSSILERYPEDTK